jgi:hypothetical protein
MVRSDSAQNAQLGVLMFRSRFSAVAISLLIAGVAVQPALATTTLSPTDILSLSISGGLALGTCSTTLSVGSSCQLAGNSGDTGFLLTTIAGSPGDFTISQGGPGAAPDIIFLTDLTTPFTSASLSTDSNITNFGPGNVSLVGNEVEVNLNGATLNGGATINVAIGSSAAPEPATWALMMLGIFGIGAALRLKRRSALAAAWLGREEARPRRLLSALRLRAAS